MKVLELFAGSRSIGKAAERFGCEVFSVDNQNFEGIDLVIDIEFLTSEHIPFKPFLIWASPPCTTYSIAGISKNRNNGTPINIDGEKSDRLIKNVLRLIKYYNCIFYIENPVGYLHKMNFMKGIPRRVVWYCKYGDNRAKPTFIFSNNIYNPMFNPKGWKAKPVCFKNNHKCHHEKAPRGSNTGTQGAINVFEAGKIPDELCDEIILSTKLKSISE